MLLSKITDILKKDSYLVGIFLAVIVAIAGYLITIGLLSRNELVEGLIYLPRPRVPAMVGLVANILLFRYYMVGVKLEKTGKGLLFVTFVSFILVFLFL
jgi:hypothetical protein